MTEKQLDFIISLHIKIDRQGPGSEQETLHAIKLSGLSNSSDIKILDIGCGTGAQTKVLAENLNGKIIALDLFQPFLNELKSKYDHQNIQTLIGSMEELPFEKESFDVIWSEGAIYNMGFSHGLKYLHSFLKPNGIIAVSEITWLTDDRPQEIQDFWNLEYPEIDTIQGKINTINNSGYKLLDCFTLSEDSWLNNYYKPLEIELNKLQNDKSIDSELKEVIESYHQEIDLYNKFKDFFGYGFYVAQRID